MDGDGDYVGTVATQQDLGDEHVQSHVHELTELDGHVTTHQVGEEESAFSRRES